MLTDFFGTLEPRWVELRTLAARESPDLRMECGTEVMLDTAAPDVSDPRVRLAGMSFALVEFPYMGIPPNSVPAMVNLRMKG